MILKISVGKSLSPDYAQILYCSNEIIRRALRTARATRKAGAPSVGLLNVPYSTFAGADPKRVPSRAFSGRRFRRFVTRTCA